MCTPNSAEGVIKDKVSKLSVSPLRQLTVKSMHRNGKDLKKKAPADRLSQYMANICMKLNDKFGHTNHKLDFAKHLTVKLSVTNKPSVTDTLILGADVTHATPGGLRFSIAAVVGSADEHYPNFTVVCATRVPEKR